jgi:hypothetical protein
LEKVVARWGVKVYGMNMASKRQRECYRTEKIVKNIFKYVVLNESLRSWVMKFGWKQWSIALEEVKVWEKMLESIDVEIRSVCLHLAG